MSTSYFYDNANVDAIQLVDEINVALPGKPIGVVERKTQIEVIHNDGDLLSGDKTTLDTVVSDHKVNASVRSLDISKESRKEEIDRKTRNLIAEGFTYSAKVFSMSANAQSKWHALHADRANHTYPVVILTMDETDEVSLADTLAVEAFYTAMVTEVRGHIDSGATLKKSIRDAADQAAIDAVVDGR
jgi:hypothetical protein